MTEAVSQIISRIGGLSQGERAELAYAFVCSLESEDEGVQEAWDEELSRRLAEIDRGEIQGRSADEVFAELRQRRK